MTRPPVLGHGALLLFLILLGSIAGTLLGGWLR